MDSHDSASRPALSNSLLMALIRKTPCSSVALRNVPLTLSLMLTGPCFLFSSIADLDSSLDDSSFASSFGRFASETAFARDLESENCWT